MNAETFSKATELNSAITKYERLSKSSCRIADLLSASSLYEVADVHPRCNYDSGMTLCSEDFRVMAEAFTAKAEELKTEFNNL